MLDLSALSQLKDLKNSLHEEKELKTGTVVGSFGRYGFVQNEQDRIFLTPDQMSLTLIGDTIEFSIEDNNGKQAANVESIVKSELKELVGRYIIKGKGHFVEAIDPRIQTHIYIPETFRKNCEENDVVQIKITQHPFQAKGNTQAKILSNLGNTSTAGIWHEVAKLQHNLVKPAELNESDIQYFEDKFNEVLTQRSNPKQDFSHLDFFTIDGESSQDLDDALCVEKTAEGYNLFVAIADPSVLLDSEHKAYKQALKSTTSTYLPGQTVAMLPKILSNNICSLLPNKKSLALVLKLEFNNDFIFLNGGLIEGIIESKNKYSYEQVDKLLDNQENIIQLKNITDSLYKLRKENEIVMQQSSDYEFIINDDLSLKSINKRNESKSRKIIEECMIFANKWIAEFLSNQNKGLFISQGGLRPNTIEQVNEFLTPIIKDYDPIKISDSSYFKQCFNEISFNDQLCIQKRLQRSSTSTNADKHWAMGIEKYCTFTSPIRKLNDFINHQFLHSILSNKNEPIVSDEVLSQLNTQVRTARQAANQTENQLRIDYINEKDIFDARMTHSSAGNIIFEIIENGAQCQFILRKIKSDFNPLNFSHTIKGTAYHLNDIFKIQITKKDSFSSTLECIVLKNEE
ncbi:MAG: RNB domain-containing ribonuclease [Saccharospirillaceae bacterium]|nr:RNB domain-containing ribonuclease [Pseudomonadales bacterium]NRB78594.1 RNB domain-containing ribonuclease [Saccharospirillaceae bacterium]